MLHGQTRYNVKSRFFDELPDEALKWLTPRTGAFGSGYARQYQEAWARGSGLSGIVGAGRVEPPVFAAPPPPPPSGAGRAAAGAVGVPQQVRRRRGADARRPRRRCARAGQLRAPWRKWLLLSVAKLTPVD
jgi:DNA helicase II / ATP-dependent DNA helicase PcrA